MTDSLRFPLSVLLVAAWLAPGLSIAADPPGSLPVSTSVKSLSATKPEALQPSTPPAMMRAEPPPATLPAERLPQYQMGYRRSDSLSISELQNGEIRFVLAVPAVLGQVGHPLLVRLAVEVDGQPFPAARQKTIGSSIAAVATPMLSVDPTSSEPSVSDEANQQGADEKAAAVEGVAGESGEIEATENESGIEDATRGSDEATYALTTERVALLRRYAEAIGEGVSGEEADWLLTHWTDGPQLLLLHPYFQRFRADQCPAFEVLDRDRDGTVSAQEFSVAVESFKKCDANRDDIVDVLELAKSAAAVRDAAAATADSPLLMLLSDLRQVTQDDPAWLGVFAHYDDDQDGQISEDEVDALRKQRPDIELAVRFVTTNPEESTLTLVTTSADLQPSIDATSSLDGLNLKIVGTTFNFSAVQSPAADQISLGAVIDGYPLLPGLDPNDDGRFTLRELRQLDSRLRPFDVDGDGRLTRAEARPPIRVCIGLGATVHRELASVRTIKQSDQPGPLVGPDWFVRMDRNKDNDLTRGEFPGTDEQFESLDADGDTLVDAREAIEFDKRSTQSDVQ